MAKVYQSNVAADGGRHPLRDDDEELLEAENSRQRGNPYRHPRSREYDRLFMATHVSCTKCLVALRADRETAERIVELALTHAGISWLYIERSREFITALTLVFYLRRLAHTDLIRQHRVVADARSQKRMQSSSNDVVFDSEEWLTHFIAGLTADRRRAADLMRGFLSRRDLADLLNEHSLEVTRKAASLWRKPSQVYPPTSAGLEETWSLTHPSSTI